MITLDGSTLEGGGQLTRMALSLSAITGIPVRIHSIRGGRAARHRRRQGKDQGSTITTASAPVPASTSHRKDRRQDDNEKDKRRGAGGVARGRHPTDHAQHRRNNNNNNNNNNNDNDQHGGGGGKGKGRGGAGGLHHSHLAALEFLADQCNARVEGAVLGSTEVVFRPGKAVPRLRFDNDDPFRSSSSPSPDPDSRQDTGRRTRNRNRDFTVALHTPGSVWLIFQAIYPFLVFGLGWPPPLVSPSQDNDDNDTTTTTTAAAPPTDTITLHLHGGTHVSSAMTTEYVTSVFIPATTYLGLPRVAVETVRRGWAGSAPVVGYVKVTVYRPPTTTRTTTAATVPYVLGGFTLPPPLPSTQLTQLTISLTVLAHPTIHPTLLPPLLALLTTTFPSSTVTHEVTPTDHQSHLSLLLIATHPLSPIPIASASALPLTANPRNTPALKALGESLVRDLRVQLSRVGGGGGGGGSTSSREGGACVDPHLEDQLVIFQALAAGGSRIRCGDGGGDGEEGDGDDGDVDEDGNPVDPERVVQVGDAAGTMHTRTARWVCEQVLSGMGVRFETGGRAGGVGWCCGLRGKEGEGGLDLGLEGLGIGDDDDEEEKEEDEGGEGDGGEEKKGHRRREKRRRTERSNV